MEEFDKKQDRDDALLTFSDNKFQNGCIIQSFSHKMSLLNRCDQDRLLSSLGYHCFAFRFVANKQEVNYRKNKKWLGKIKRH